MSDYTLLEPTRAAFEQLSDSEYARVEELSQFIDVDVESWFTSSVACCDKCIDNYISSWPNAFRHDKTFQRNAISFKSFYKNARRVSQEFSEAEFERLLQYVGCPRCLNSIGTNLYPYELPFDVPAEWESKQKALAECASSTPFLLLRESFAKEVFSEVKNACAGIKLESITEDLFRGRRLDKAPNERDFFPPRRQDTKEGRYNHSGIPVFYLADNRLTCWRECRMPNSDFYVSRVKIGKPLKTLNLAESEELSPTLQALIFSSLMSAPTAADAGWHLPQYVLTRFVADCARAAGVHAIMYPSVRCGEGKNLAILDVQEPHRWLTIDDIRPYRNR